MARADNRGNADLRPVRIHKDYLAHPKGSVLIEMGRTRVICAVSVRPGVPRWMREQNVAGGWLTAEYAMLPGATADRKERESTRGRPQGRSQEIQRLIGRALRAVVDLRQVGSNAFYVDCDVIDADGGTRCASITGAAVALQLAFRKMFMEGSIKKLPMEHGVAAVSVGMVDGEALLDLCYTEDAAAGVDMNVVLTDEGRFVEIQGTAEEKTFTRSQSNQMLDLAEGGIRQLFEAQQKVLKV